MLGVRKLLQAVSPTLSQLAAAERIWRFMRALRGREQAGILPLADRDCSPEQQHRYQAGILDLTALEGSLDDPAVSGQ